ncbi:MAG: hypothetical protein ACXVXJ_04680 [Mycobacteriaceae bacterium]
MTPRPRSAIEGEMRSICSLDDDADQQIASINRQMATLEQHRDYLIYSKSLRAEKMDRLLDELSMVLTADRIVTA